MKNFLIAVIFVSFLVQIKAQNKPTKNHFGIGIDYKLQREVHIIQNYDIFPGTSFVDYRIESYNYFPALKFDYYLNRNISLNLFFRPSFVNKNVKNENLDSYTRYSDSQINKFAMDLGFGFEKHFFHEFKIDPFFGVNVHYLYGGKGIITEKRITYQDDVINREYKTKVTGVETHGFYSTVNFGMNYFVSRNFSLGINLDLGYRYSLQKGISERIRRTVAYDDNGVWEDETTNEYTEELINVNNGFIYSFSIKSAFYFPLKKKDKK